ncbi:MAG: galactokinase [Deltaproteobacteria bacterium]|nr:galactokinase [Deltaproteobacteria bacterium]
MEPHTREGGLELRAAFAAAFGAPPAAAARAPGRVNLIGEHTDYNGGLVLPAAIELATRVAVRMRSDSRVVGLSRERGAASSELDEPPAGDWLDYARGTARVLADAGLLRESGFEIAVRSDLPEGAGLSSSAALEAATSLALLAASGGPEVALDRPDLARLCQRAEAEFAGVPCGIMDQYAVLCSEPGSALLLDCASLVASRVPLPAGVEIQIFDTGVSRGLRSGGYAQRRADCERALSGARRALGRKLASLSELSIEELADLARSLDPVALRRARHVVSENARVREFARALAAGELERAGAEMFASHESLRSDYDVTVPESDALVEESRGLPGCIGARMTGAGLGGCTVHLVRAEQASLFAAALTDRFRARFAREPRFWRTRAAGGAGLI